MILKLEKAVIFMLDRYIYFFFLKVKLKIKHLKMKWFWRFSIAQSEREKISKICQISIFGFQCVAKNRERWLKICASYHT
jgi:hypothetical protein